MALSKKGLFAVAFTLVLLASMLIGVQFVREAKANAFSLPSNPNKTPPTLIIYSPINNTVTDTAVSLNFTVIKPPSYGSGFPYYYYDVGISYIHCILDGTTYSVFQTELINPAPQDLLPTISNFSATLHILCLPVTLFLRLVLLKV